MAIDATTFATLDGNFKRVYGKYLSRIPTFGILRDKVSFDQKKKIGDDYRETIELELEHGFTYETGTTDNFTLQAPVVGGSKPASIQSSVTVLRTGLGLRSLYASGNGDAAAFRETTKNRVANMWKSTNKRLELDLLYGQCSDTGNTGSGGLGVVESHTAGTAVFVITKASWSPALWAGMKGALIEFFAPADPPTDIRTHTGPGINGYGANTYTQVSKVDAATRTITVTANMGGADEPVPNDIIFLHGQRTTGAWKTMIGLHRICSQVSGTIFGIDTSTYDQWMPNVKNAAAAPLSFDLINELVNDAIGKGLEGPVTVLTSPFQWGKMMTDLSAMRRIDYSQNTNKYVVGASSIEFHSANGKCTILPHPYVKTAISYIVTFDGDSYSGSDQSTESDSNVGGAFSRGGITDVTFERPSGLTRTAQTSPRFFYETNNEYNVELRCVSDQFLFCNAIGHQTMIHNLATT